MTDPRQPQAQAEKQFFKDALADLCSTSDDWLDSSDCASSHPLFEDLPADVKQAHQAAFKAVDAYRGILFAQIAHHPTQE